MLEPDDAVRFEARLVSLMGTVQAAIGNGVLDVVRAGNILKDYDLNN
jgi:hypothetical protein